MKASKREAEDGEGEENMRDVSEGGEENMSCEMAMEDGQPFNPLMHSPKNRKERREVRDAKKALAMAKEALEEVEGGEDASSGEDEEEDVDDENMDEMKSFLDESETMGKKDDDGDIPMKEMKASRSPKLVRHSHLFVHSRRSFNLPPGPFDKLRPQKEPLVEEDDPDWVPSEEETSVEDAHKQMKVLDVRNIIDSEQFQKEAATEFVVVDDDLDFDTALYFEVCVHTNYLFFSLCLQLCL